ncbi:hypothetical protein WOLCODRAFT_138786 [Wolfiporia cocos MD-104 SS10]|uniref:Uncharacterized protein n=1 Tax=Wolfiporia cocos (strain MD-104) TaxID=742152 RepID=A0A2H3JVW7_WOLCO|nr:hypothetical protein WOLCODRAFT_138786 [Wolfiporia cocos MD-104 SS10]
MANRCVTDGIPCLATLIPTICSTISELLVVVVTWIYTSHWRINIRKWGTKTPLVTILLVDGTIYFLVFVLVNLFTFALQYCPLAPVSLSSFLMLSPNIMLSRFILNLRNASASQIIIAESSQQDSREIDDTISGSSALQTTLRFSPGIIGNMGEPLSHDYLRDQDVDEEDLELEEMDCNEDLEIQHVDVQDSVMQSIQEEMIGTVVIE